jgi:hypothetical protein
MSDHLDEMRIELPETEAPPEYDPQADRRAEIAEAYEKRREAEIIAQREQMGLPAEEATEPPVSRLRGMMLLCIRRYRRHPRQRRSCSQCHCLTDV